ncbi:hypothetical protein R3I93_004699 [Phoxinus phoxinus]|uniref:Uncharacterized protein n=1 Tax=Phoxinus phoxinus TaxID=58324 RepID=A0AAN9DJJ1_9TELE
MENHSQRTGGPDIQQQSCRSPSQGQPDVPEVTGRGRGGGGGAVRERRGRGPTRSDGSLEDEERVEALQRNRRAVTEV